MPAEAIDLLTTKGRFQPDQAVILAEVIDMGIRDAQPVTVPILNARFSEFEARWAVFEAKMEARFAAIEARMAALETKMAAFEAKMEARFAAFEAKMDRKFDRLRFQLIIAVIVSNLAAGPLGTALLEVIKRAF